MGAKIHVTEIWSNFAILFGGPLALILALWRSWIAMRQQMTDARGRLDDRFQRGASMLESKEFAVRKAGIIILERLSRDHTHSFHIQVVDLLALFTRYNCETMNSVRSGMKKPLKTIYPSDKVVKVDPTGTIDALKVITNREKLEVLTYIKTKGGSDKPLVGLSNFNNYKSKGFTLPDLDKSNFQYVDLSCSVFSGLKLTRSCFDHSVLESAKFIEAILCFASFRGACLDEVDFSGANLTGVNFYGASLKDAKFIGANLEGANLMHANLSGANFDQSENLMQRQLDNACQSKGRMPQKLGGLKWDKTKAMKCYCVSRWPIIRWLAL